MTIMSSKLIYFFALLCVVNASVITINALDDDPESKIESNQKDCNYRACDQRCRNMGFPSGVCVNGRCKCDNFLKAKDEVSEIEQLSNIEEAASPKSCNMRACDQLCRRLKFRGGACVDGHCKCNIFRNAEDVLPNSVESKSESVDSLKTCSLVDCSNYCRLMGFSGAICISDQCWCTNFLNTKGDVYNTAESLSETEDAQLQRCDIVQCSEMCRKIGLPHASCVQGDCWCQNVYKTEDKDSQNESVWELVEIVGGHQCYNRTCFYQCRRRGFNNGSCVNGYCKCQGSRNKTVAEMSETAAPLSEKVDDLEENVGEHRCSDRMCNYQCRRRGYNSGTCIDGQCKCEGSRNKPALDTETVDEMAENVGEHHCYDRMCNYQCRRRGYNSGTCINDQCKCEGSHNKLALETETVDELAENVGEHHCYNRMCNYLCRRRGYNSGTCVNDQCKCEGSHNKLAEAFKTEQPLSETLGQTEENVGEHRCDDRMCNYLCRRRGYNSGTCVNNQCKCEGSRNKPAAALGTEEPRSETVDELAENVGEYHCSNRMCNYHCRRRGYNSGTCVNDQCKCEGSHNKPALDTETVDELAENVGEHHCYDRMCNYQCRRRGYNSGTCVNDQCKCEGSHNKLALETEKPVSEMLDEFEENVGEHRCENWQCNYLCRRRGYNSGTCVDGQCRCQGSRNKTAEVLETEQPLPETVDELTDNVGEYRCYNWKCNYLCRRRGYNSGTCVDNQCRCQGSRNKTALETEEPLPEMVDNELEENVGDYHCQNRMCNYQCRRRGYNSGTCVDNQCRCQGSRNKTALETEEPLPEMVDNELEENVGDYHCYDRMCNYQCRRRGYNSGTCIDGQCKCQGSRNKTAEVSETEVPTAELVETQGGRCFHWKCNSLCRRRGYNSGTCNQNGRCKCQGLRNKTESPLSPSEDVASNKPEETSFIPKTDEGELSEDAPSLSNCNTVRCNDMCHRLNFIGGMCRGGTCRCY